MFSSAFIKGHSHLKCEDYAIHGNKSGFLSDGCSGAVNSDIGSKILPFYAYEGLNHFLYTNNDTYNFKEYVFDLEKKVKRFIDVSDPLHSRSLVFDSIFSCTLGGIVQHSDKIHISLLGDGCIYYETVTGEANIIIVRFGCNYPFYISYLFKQSNFDSWDSLRGNDIDILHYRLEGNNWVLIPQSIPNNTLYLTITHSIDDINLAAVFSDGPEQAEGMTTIEAIVELTNFKNFNTDFAWRRLKRFEENRSKQELYNHDDISMVVYKRD